MPSNTIINISDLESVSVFKFNADRSKVAVSPNDSKVNIYAISGSNLKLESTFTEHSERVTGIDWCPKNNRILTCGADRNAYVWNLDKSGEWKPSLVLLRIDRAAICCSWSPSEDKFAVGTGSKLICVCYYEVGNDWWVSKHIKKPIRSSVLCLDWHPGSSVLAAGSSDFCVRVFSAAIKETKVKPVPTPWGEKTSFGAVFAEFRNTHDGWVHSVNFSPSGNRLVWTSHDATVSCADVTSGQPATYLHKLTILPFQTCLFLDEDTIICGGHNNSPFKFKFDGKTITFVEDIDKKITPDKAGAQEQSAMARFKNLDTLAQAGAVKSTAQKTTHGNTITCLNRIDKSKFASSGLDSKIVIWSL
ncbi:Actin-related protein 2/3 complex subunit 1A [Thelohanellus kitauei]|uniref:Actin-related protein 2/3 complex subunit n=1 Tax=Thelohanellus kitauei TaxID=669202 RepID=A0A0C2JB01_THEKT|nr:Actin-related protein 2/3 complex subunit 1A [Thelohanellus kitauei]